MPRLYTATLVLALRPSHHRGVGYGLMVALVPLADLERVAGSGDETIVRDAVGDRCDREVAEAIGRIVDGTATDREHASAYGYGLQRICEAIGEGLPNEAFYPASLGALLAFDEHFRERRIAFRLESLTEGTMPIPLPRPEEFPAIGTVGPRNLDTLVLGEPPDERSRAAWETIGGWLDRWRTRIAEDPDGRWALVGFYY